MPSSQFFLVHLYCISHKFTKDGIQYMERITELKRATKYTLYTKQDDQDITL
jgi:hypothetical protein